MEGRNNGLFCSSLYSQCSELCSSHNKSLINTLRIEWCKGHIILCLSENMPMYLCMVCIRNLHLHPKWKLKPSAPDFAEFPYHHLWLFRVYFGGMRNSRKSSVPFIQLITNHMPKDTIKAESYRYQGKTKIESPFLPCVLKR